MAYEFRKTTKFTALEEEFAKHKRHCLEDEFTPKYFGVVKEPKEVRAYAQKVNPVRRTDNPRMAIPVRGTSLHTGHVITMPSVYTAARYLRKLGYALANTTNIGQVLDRPKRSAYGYKWETIK